MKILARYWTFLLWFAFLPVIAKYEEMSQSLYAELPTESIGAIVFADATRTAGVFLIEALVLFALLRLPARRPKLKYSIIGFGCIGLILTSGGFHGPATIQCHVIWLLAILGFLFVDYFWFSKLRKQ